MPDFELQAISEEFPQIVTDATRLISAFAEDFPDGEIGQHNEGNVEAQLEYAGDFLYNNVGDLVLLEDYTYSPHRDFYISIFRDYFKPANDWRNANKGQGYEENPEAYRGGLLITAVDIIRTKNGEAR